MAGVNINYVVEQLEGDLVRTRDKGLEELRYLLASSQNGPKLNGLGDDGFHRIFESLYRIARTDKGTYLKSIQSRKAPSTSRLSGTATALRLTVESGVSKIRFKTAISVIDHIIGTLPVTDDDFCEPLRNDYLKCFRILLDYPPYGEHLKPKQWQEFVDFTIAGIAISIGEDDQESNHISGRDTSMTSKNESHVSIRVSQSSVKRSSRYASKSSLEDLLAALRALSSLPNAPIITKASSIVDSVLHSLGSSTRGQDIALEIFNNVALVLKTENVGLLLRCIFRLITLLYKLWSTKSAALRDQILILLSIVRPLFIAEPAHVGYLEPAWREKIRDILEEEYAERSPREMLQFDDMAVELLSFERTHEGIVLVPRRDIPRAASNWSLLSSLAFLSSGLETSTNHDSTLFDEREHLNKRRKLVTSVSEIMQRAIQASGRDKLAALHFLYFLCDRSLPLPEDFETTMLQLKPSLLSDDSQIVVWTMLVLSRFAWRPSALTVRFRDFWAQVWEHTRRALATFSTSRAACLLVDTILRRDLCKPTTSIAAVQDSIFAGSSSGPVAATDTALILFTGILQSEHVDRDDVFQAFALRVIGWLEVYWSLPAVLDRSHNSHLALHVQPEFICSLLSALRGGPLQFEVHYRITDTSALTRADAMIQDLAGFSSYLAGVPKLVNHGFRPRLTLKQHPLGSEAKARLSNAVYVMLQAKANQARSSWEIYATERSSNVGDDVLSIAISICIAIKANLSTAGVDASAFAAVTKAQDELWQKVVDLLTESKGSNESRASLVCARVLQIRDPAVSTSPILATQFQPFLQVLSDTLRQLLQVGDEEEIVDIDMMGSMETRTSQGTQPGASQRATEVNRRELPESAMANAFPISYLLDLSIVSARAHGESALSHSNIGTVIDEFEALDAGPLLMARQSIYSLVGEQTSLTRRDAARLLKHLAVKVLQADDYERSEAAMCCCAKVMTALAPLWTSDSDDDLADCAFDIYRWFIEAALGKGIASPQASYEIALMLDSVSGLAPRYGSNEDMPSPRTSLLKILLNAPSALKYQLSACLTRMFDRYVLTEHGAIFNDIVEALPTDPDDVEGIAVRFHVLAELGSHWHTVLRQATYHLFETAIHVPKLTSLARCSLLTMSEALQLPSAKELFCAFAPQIFYTWLGNGQIKDLPFEAFGYPSLAALVRDNLSELVAQTALRGSKEHAEELAGLLDTDWANLLDKAFAHAEAYCLASQTSLPDSEQLRVNSETLIRKDLGTDVYSKNLREELPSVISHLFNALQDDHAAERAFEKAGLNKPLSVLKRIRGRSAYATVLPTSQQPSFRARFIVEEIGWLCKRIEFEFNGLWTSPILVLLYRQLLRSVNHVLGPLNAASVLRKIRMVVSLGERNALRGYPLEMLLHNLRPFLTVFQCSEDAIGLYWYLLEAGSEHLRSNLSFLAGLGVSIFASLTNFILSSQERTTQESQYLSTMSKAKEFRKWLGRYLSTLEPDEDDVTKVGTFRTLVQHAKSMTGAGSSSKSSPEGNVLLQLLLDRKCDDPLLKDMHFYLSVGILCKDFIAAAHPLDDISTELTDHNCISVLREILARISLPDAFRTWVGSVVGRAYSAIGPSALHALPVLRSEASRRVDKKMTVSNSYGAIIKCLEGLIWQEDVLVAAYSEQCLQSIATGLDRSTALSVLGEHHDQTLLSDVGFQDFPCPEPYEQASSAESLSTLEHWHAPQDPRLWASTLVSTLCGHLANDPILGPLRIFAMSSPTAAGQLVPYVVHLILAAEFSSAQSAKMRLSNIFGDVLKKANGDRDSVPKIAIEAILYLRHCLLPTELHLAQRNQWLDVDFGDAAKAAVACELWHEALLFVEVQQSQVHLLASRSLRRSTQTGTNPSPESLAVIFKNVDDPDFFYAGHEDLDLSSVIRRLNHESSGFKMLSFQSAVFDAVIRTQQDKEMLGNAAVSAARALNAANFRGISQAVTGFANAQMQPALGREVGEPFFDLYDWNVHTDTMPTHDMNPMRPLQALTGVSTKISMLDMLDAGLLQSTDHLPKTKNQSTSYRHSICAIAALSEAREVLTLKGLEDFDSFFERAAAIDDWNQTQDIEEIIPFLSAREYIFGTVRRNYELQTALDLTKPQALIFEARTVRQSLQVAQHHSASQFSLSRATYLSSLSDEAVEMGLHLEAASQFDLASTFWDQGEASASVKILQRLRDRDDLKTQSIPIEMSDILADLGSKAADARLEPPDEIIANYLVPAYKELGGNTMGSKAGRVFHNFASFCDGQLQDPDNHDDYMRIKKIREIRFIEVQELEKLLESRDHKNREAIKRAHSDAKKWYKLDDEEFRRVQANREILILRCLENYLQAMRACEDFPNDSLRVVSIWLDVSDNVRVNKTVEKFLGTVPSIKFAGLVNQLTSRLVDIEDEFGQTLMGLLYRICTDHPYHSMYQLFAASKSKGGKGDDAADSRHRAATKLSDLLRQKSASGNVWIAVHNASIAFVRVAQVRLSDKAIKTGSKFLLRNISNGLPLVQAVEAQSRRMPPPTMRLALRSDCDYSSEPVMTEFEPHVTIAGGVSAPKIVTVRASDGSRNKMLLKGGNDDLRQDSIMEQVFEQVSNLLKDHRATRQRKLGIRTYKVIPLVTNAGIIEFVQDTKPLHDFLLPAHTQYFPKDFSPNKCRKAIADAQSKPLQQRVQAYRHVTQNFHPVMRFFFTEYFLDPDDWFYKRLNYSRSTAAISILGHVLGLGDRHGHNILLDTNTGEVVHIDLGVAFEAGRVLPVPEVVPFRLTRDLVDGMGISSVEGAFRRSCNFTLEALRRDKDDIMTILDVLRYDPLYSWSLSPVRLQRMQENAEAQAAAAAAAANADTNATGTTDGAIAAAGMAAAGLGRKEANEPSEADRALNVVLKKLGKSLSVEATVNELIRQATDERNLAVLYCGWQAYA